MGAFLLVICFLSLMFLPLYAQAASFSDMLASFTRSSSSWEGNKNTLLHKISGKPPIPERKPSWIAQKSVVSSEQLLDAEGHWNVVEQGREYDPAQAHLNARKKVNTARRKTMKELSPHFEPYAKSGNDGKLRILKIELQDGIDYDVVEGRESGAGMSLFEKVLPVFTSELSVPPVSAFEQETEAVAVVLLDGEGSDDSSIIVPKVKPRRGSDRDVVLARQNNVGGVMLVRSDSKVRMIGGVAVPPSVPVRKRVLPIVVGVVDENILLSSHGSFDDVEKISDPDPLMDGAVIPKIKPAKERVLGGKPEFKAALTNMLGISEVNMGNISAGIVPIPVVKPKRGRVVLEHGSASAGRVFVKNLRSGVHPDKTRIVIEVSNITEYKVTVDGLRNVLRVKLANTRWDISAQDKLKGSPLLGTYIAREQKNGSVLLEVRLKAKVKIVGTMVLRPNTSSAHRIVIDLKVL